MSDTEKIQQEEYIFDNVDSTSNLLLDLEMTNKNSEVSLEEVKEEPKTLRNKKSPESKRYIPSEEDYINSLQKRRSVVKDAMNIFVATKNDYKECTEKEALKFGIENEATGDSHRELVWLDIQSPTKEFMEELERVFDLHPLTTEDIITSDTREKIEVFDDYLFVVVKELHYEYGTNRLVQSNVNIVVFEHIVITVHKPELQCISKVFYVLECKKQKHGIFEGSDWVLHAVMDSAVDLFKAYVDRMSMEAEALDSLVLVFSSGEQNDLLRRIGMARRLITTLRGKMWNIRDMLVTLTSKQHPFIGEEIKIYLRDVLDNIVSMEQKLDASKETLNNLHQTYLARISLEAAEASNRVNAVMKKFSAVATIFIPMTLISGLWGMNVKVPGEGVDNHYWFIGIALVLLGYVAASAILFKRRDWF